METAFASVLAQSPEPSRFVSWGEREYSFQRHRMENPVTIQINPKFVDLSHYDDVQDKFAGAVAFGIRGVINKLTEGVGNLDHSAGWRIGPATAAGLLFGVYHFMRPGRIVEQAKWFLQNYRDLQAANPGVFIRIALDHETAGVSVDDVKQWLTIVHDATGQWPWLYSYSAFLTDQFVAEKVANNDPFFDNIGLWIAAYNDHPHWPPNWERPVAHQYTGDGNGLPPHNVAGIVIVGSKGIDINTYAGTDEQLAADWVAVPAPAVA
jgi:GH25 family lysozyme M1 (1,4-beta-N-acetylmuramidase)